MDFAFTQEQLLIRDTADAFLAEHSNSHAVRAAMATDKGYDGALWQLLCEEMYWQALLIPEQYDGLELGYVELSIVLEQMGRRLLCSPFFSTIGLGVNSLLIAGTEEQQQTYLPQIVTGDLTATLAYTSAKKSSDNNTYISGNQAWGSQAVQTQYKQVDDGYLLNGDLRYVIDGHSADLLIIAARQACSAANTADDCISLFVVSADSPEIRRQLLPSMDQTRKLAHIEITDLQVPASAMMINEGHAAPLLQQIFELSCIALAAEQLGGVQQILDDTVTYIKERSQFGRPIGSFQAMKHKAADMMLKAEALRSAVYYAACIAEQFLQRPADRDQLANELTVAASIAKAYASDAYYFNAGQGLQMHGGVGFTWEYDVHLYFKRAKSSQHMLGNACYHRERLASQLLGPL